MELAWNPLALAGLLVGAVELALAFVIQTTRPGVAQNARLAVVLVFSGLANVTYSFRLLLTQPADGYAILFVFMPLAILSGAAILPFLATLPTPLAAPLRSRAAGALLGLCVAGLLVALFVEPTAYIRGMRPFPHTTGFEFGNGALWNVFGVLFAATLLFGLACAVDAWRRAPPGIARQRAGTFAIGFGVQAAADAAVVLYLQSVGDLDSVVPTVLNFVAQPLTALFFSGTIAYGILRFQLLDIDLRIKRGIRGGALAGAFFAVFFVVTELAQLLFQDSVGPAVGIVAAGLLVFALHPLQRAADRIADTAMPHVGSSPAYLAFRRLEIYREAAESLLADGRVSEKERAALERLRVKLGIAAPDAAALESDVLAARA